jgi:hypothetical protein
MQVTDLHFFCHPDKPELDKRTIEELPRLRDLTQPDLIMVTGDFWHDNPGGKGQEYAEFAIDKISGLGVPWIFTWGNHDMLNDYAKGHDTSTTRSTRSTVADPARATTPSILMTRAAPPCGTSCASIPPAAAWAMRSGSGSRASSTRGRARRHRPHSRSTTSP